MEFDFVSLAFGGEQHISIWDSKRIASLKPDDQELLTKLLDVFGKKSAVAQGLGAPVTDIYRLRSTDQRLYLYMYRESRKTVVLGGLKVGSKRLFVRTATSDLREIEPVCVLDFYVHESCQRQGVGKALFEHFLMAEGHDPATLAYDRPSPKLLAFLQKHYGLDQYVPQSNNYVVYDRYWELCPPGSRQHRGHGAMPPGASGHLQGRNGSRGSIASIGTPSGHGGPRATPLVGMMPPGSGAGGYPAHWTPSALGSHSGAHHSGPPAPIGNSPSFGRRWASNNFGHDGPPQEPPPYPAPGTAGGPAFSIPPAGGDAQGGIVDALDAFAARQQQQQQQGTGLASPQRGGAGAPWERDAGGPAGAGTGYGSGGAPGTWPPQGGGPPLPAAGTPSGMQPPGSRGAYSFRPPWATDEPAGSSGGAGGSNAGGGTDAGPGAAYTGFGSPPPPMRTPSKDRFGVGPGAGGAGPMQRSPMHSILGGGGGYDAVAGGRSGAAQARALQQQLLSMQSGEGAAAAAAAGVPVLGGYGGGSGSGSAYPGSYQQHHPQAPSPLYSGAPPASGSGRRGEQDGVGLPAGMMRPGPMAMGTPAGAGPSGRRVVGPDAADTPPGGGHSAAKMMAVKQRSGAGAADCLVW
ncbi:hypothetical protein HYH02_009636 [Chlamydomonas schloesseri]|uniref:Alpha-tubulin N-acetyltransferase n=1 Tax=Chlamydomonas schloesseri TaxID=2026947 RepID=A0A835TBK5_9CHLO|nr:hypothetical protein HYH02_009636 [Chlamydomonas schloesseri]|eukprot:KAG2442148.1 hypothetical protein HYH02_009636 [Chlamydomonas schloesseri]